MHRAAFSVGFLLASLCACHASRPLPREGLLPVEGGKIWYRIVGAGRGTPLVVLHGGPGAPSYYLESLAILGADRPVVFYDQLGGGRSDQPADTTLWRIPRFLAELQTLRDSLHLPKIHLLGHSWGAMLATDYVLSRPEGVQSLILASPLLSVARYRADIDSLIRLLPESTQTAIRNHESAGTFASPDYQAAMAAFYSRFLARRPPPVPALDSTLAHFGSGVYGYMWGPSEFTLTGSLRTYERTDRLGELTLPILLTAGEHDEVPPAAIRYYHTFLPAAQLAIIPGSGHLTTVDAPHEYAATVRAFLASVEAH